MPLHWETSRKEAFALFGIQFHQQRHRTTGLSPQLPDGGYFIWITLDKTELEENYDYKDCIDSTSVTWITRRGVTEDQDDYRALQSADTRISVFLRSQPKHFTYVGEVRCHGRPDIVSSGGRPQLRYLFRLDHHVPDTILQQLYAGVGRAKPMSRAARVSTSRLPTRRPTTFGQTREALAYVLGDVQRVTVPAQHSHQGIALWRGTSTPRSVLTRQPDQRRIWALGGTAEPNILSGFREFRLGDVFAACTDTSRRL
ncbi:MAG TPA: DUF3427 domain-containing protein [Vicinamibacterales bacterium]|nr:DUF3427 domain-containing protein [Vicinamibacterales bacterium]